MPRFFITPDDCLPDFVAFLSSFPLLIFSDIAFMIAAVG